MSLSFGLVISLRDLLVEFVVCGDGMIKAMLYGQVGTLSILPSLMGTWVSVASSTLLMATDGQTTTVIINMLSSVKSKVRSFGKVNVFITVTSNTILHNAWVREC